MNRATHSGITLCSTPVSQATDGELVRRCHDNRDAEAWAELVGRHSASVYAVARQVFGLALHDAEDVFQETFARTYQHIRRVREPEAVGGYIKQITRRLCIDQLRSRVHDPLPEQEASEMIHDDEALLGLENGLSVHQAVDRLPEPSREVIDRFFFRDETYSTISQALEIPYGTIASRIARGLERVRIELGE